MKYLAACCLMLAACVAPAPTMLDTAGPLTRQIARVVERHDVYVALDPALSGAQRSGYFLESQGVLEMVKSNPQVSADLLAPRLTPVMDRHDAYVQEDAKLEALERETYLASTAQLRSLLFKARQLW